MDATVGIRPARGIEPVASDGSSALPSVLLLLRSVLGTRYSVLGTRDGLCDLDLSVDGDRVPNPRVEV